MVVLSIYAFIWDWDRTYQLSAAVLHERHLPRHDQLEGLVLLPTVPGATASVSPSGHCPGVRRLLGGGGVLRGHGKNFPTTSP